MKEHLDGHSSAYHQAERILGVTGLLKTIEAKKASDQGRYKAAWLAQIIGDVVVMS